MTNNVQSLIAAVKENCMISDARDNGIYSMCMLFLRLRNLYKWEVGLQPWEEAHPPDLLDWIASREDTWDSYAVKDFNNIQLESFDVDSMEVLQINEVLYDHNLLYGAGLGRSLKAVFFLADILEQRVIADCKVTVLGREVARELDSPFAMVQDESICFRSEPFRYFLWDKIQDGKPLGRQALLKALEFHGVLNNCGAIDLDRLQERLDHIVGQEMVPIIYHEVGEMKDDILPRQTMQSLIGSFPGTVVELLVRAIKDVLADVHPEGQLGWIVCQEKVASLGFYSTYLDGMRRALFPELAEAAHDFFETGNWQLIEQARISCRDANRQRAEIIRDITEHLGKVPNEQVEERIKQEIIVPLGI